ncbi:MAG: hypothetical protein HC906_11885 [Bacteroidales bacterium]|nr:hypothetical protein [Bacteroidales bacterium]
MHYGFRVTNWSNYGEAFNIRYNKDFEPLDYQTFEKGEQYYSKTIPEPRVSFSVNSGRYSSFKLSYNKTIQHIHLINNGISPFNMLDAWLPSGPNIKPQMAHIFDLGFFHAWPQKFVDLQTDILL